MLEQPLIQITAALANVAMRVDSESELQRAVAKRFDRCGIVYEREKVLSNKERIDFLVAGIGIELKVDGSLADLTRQLDRYAGIESIEQLLVVTTRRALCRLPPELRSKGVSVIYVGGM